MPAPRTDDKDQVKMLVLAVGVREAARQCGIPEGTVLDWSRQGKWLADCKPTPAKQPLPLSMQSPISPIKPVDALANTLLTNGNAVKTNVMAYAARVTRHAERMARNSPEKALALAGDVKSTIQSAAIAGSWQAGHGEQSTVVNIALLGVSIPDQISP